MWREIPYVPLFATLFVQALATMSAYSIPAAAPAIAADVGVPHRHLDDLLDARLLQFVHRHAFVFGELRRGRGEQEDAVNVFQ